jgi:hypothetical protein
MNVHKLHARRWPAIVAVALLVAAHAALFGLVSPGHSSVVLIGGLLGLLVVKYMWWKFHR